MANSGALIKESIWRDNDFRSLPRLAQCTYQQLCAQKELDCAGLLTLNMPLLVKGCAELSENELLADLKVLEERRFVFVDYDTFEVFVRAKMRSGEVWRSPNILKSALKSARMVESPKIRVEVATELRRLRRAIADEVAEELDPLRTHPDGSPKGSQTLPEGGTLPEPSSSVSVSVSRSPSVNGYLGEQPPPPECPEHEQNSDTPCRRCKLRREWAEHQAVITERDQLDARRKLKQVVDTCLVCQGTNWVPDTDPAVRCDHQAAVHA
jgi:hypothetical protein